MLQIEGLHVFYCSLMFSALGKQKAPGRWLHRFWRVWFRRVSSVQHNWPYIKHSPCSVQSRSLSLCLCYFHLLYFPDCSATNWRTEETRAIPCTANQLWKLSSYVARQWPLKEGKGVQVLNRSVKTMKKQTYGRFWPSGMMPPWAYLWWRSRPQDLWGTVSLQIHRSLESAELRCRPLMTAICPYSIVIYHNLSIYIKLSVQF